MSHHPAIWFLGGLGVLALTPITLMFGTALMPAKIAAEGNGTVGPWFFTWGVILVTAISALVLAGFLIAVGFGKRRRSPPAAV